MVYCIQLMLLEFAQATRRNTVLNAINSRIGTKPQWQPGAFPPAAAVSRTGNPSILGDIRFISEADMDDLYNFIEGAAVGQNLPLPGSIMRVHPCNHDEQAINLCTVELQKVWA